MPQLDVFIFINTGIYLFIGFFAILVFNHLYILPSLGSILKIRRKIEVKKAEVNQQNSSVNNEINIIKFSKIINKNDSI